MAMLEEAFRKGALLPFGALKRRELPGRSAKVEREYSYA